MRDITSVVILWAKDIQNFLQIVATHYAEISPIKTYQGFRTFVKKNFQTGGITRFKHIGLWRYAQTITVIIILLLYYIDNRKFNS
jgi:hypothetical protein